MSRIYYGWMVLLVAAVAMVGTLPGRTQGLGLITESLIQDLELSRVTYAQLNFWATIIGAAGAIGIGRALDRFGSRIVLTLVSVALGVVVVLMSRVQGVVALTGWLTLTRALGQSALSVASLAIVGHWFVRRIDRAMAVYSVVMSVGFMIAFPVVGAVVQQSGWRMAWLSIGLALIAVLAPMAWFIVRRSPESCGLQLDGVDRTANVSTSSTSESIAGYSWTEAIATPAFWMFAIGAALYGLAASGIGLFNESILAERGFGPDVYYQTLVVTAMSALAGNGLAGWLANRIPLLQLLAISLAVLAGGVAVLPFVRSMLHVIAWAVMMGLGGGLIMVLFFSVWARVYGRRQLGVIQGIAQAMTVLASAIGPLALAWCAELTGSYATAFYVLAAAIGVIAIVAVQLKLPEEPR